MTNNIIVKSVQHLKELIDKEYFDYALLLNGGAFSHKTIGYDELTKKFTITNHIDDTDQELTEEEILDDSLTNIGKAIPLNSLIAIADE